MLQNWINWLYSEQRQKANLVLRWFIKNTLCKAWKVHMKVILHLIIVNFYNDNNFTSFFKFNDLEPFLAESPIPGPAGCAVCVWWSVHPRQPDLHHSSLAHERKQGNRLKLNLILWQFRYQFFYAKLDVFLWYLHHLIYLWFMICIVKDYLMHFLIFPKFMTWYT